MDLAAIAQALESSGTSAWMRSSLRALPVIESVHVMAVAVVFGTIMLIDLRLLGLRDRHRPFTTVFRELVPWTWLGFGTAVVTGGLLFMPNATTYVGNTAFWLKMATLVCAGANMAAFELTAHRAVAAWDRGAVPLAGRITGALSLLLWTSVIVFGRWIGFTKGYDFTVPEDVDFDFLSGWLGGVGPPFA